MACSKSLPESSLDRPKSRRIAAAIKTQRRKIKRSFWERSDLKRGRWPATENWGAAQASAFVAYGCATLKSVLCYFRKNWWLKKNRFFNVNHFIAQMDVWLLFNHKGTWIFLNNY